MANRKTFNDFETKSNIEPDDFLVGFDSPSAGGEKKFMLEDLRNFVTDASVTNTTASAFNISGLDYSFFSGKIFHITDGDIDTETNLCTIELPYPMEEDVRFVVVNMIDPNVNGDVTIQIKTKVDSIDGNESILQKFSAKGNLLKKKFHYAEVYTEGYGNWYGFGDLASPQESLLQIKEITDSSYTPTILDNQVMFHFKQIQTQTVSFNLPDPSDFPSGTQFYLYNFSETGAVNINKPDGVEFYARAKYLRRKYDDAVVYTDGQHWFATGDLS